MKNTNTACHFVTMRYPPLSIMILFLCFSIMSCKGKSEEKAEVAAPVAKTINIQESINELETGDLETSLKAVTDLGNSGKPEALEPLLSAMEGYEDVEIREAAALALGTLGDPDCTDRLIYALLEEESADVRNAIYKSLQEYEGFSIDPILYLVRDKDRKIREKGVKYLVGIGDTVLQDVIDFIQGFGKIKLGDADSIKKNYRDLSIALRLRDELYYKNAVGVCLGFYMEDRDSIDQMKKELEGGPYSITDPYQ